MSSTLLFGTCLVEPTSGRLVAVSKLVADWLGDKPARCGEHHVTDLVPALKQEPLAAQWASFLLETDGPSLILTSTVARYDGSGFSAELCAHRLVGPKGNHLLLVIRSRDATPDAPQHRDALTGLLDRRELANHRERWRLQSPDQPVPHAVLFMDLDDFKQVNDHWGHAAGDQVLKTLAPRWQDCVREGDLVARYGGDEFVVLLKGVRQRKDVEPIVARLVEATQTPIQVGEHQMQLTVTIGIALADDIASTDLDQLLDEADRAMYAAKRRQ